MTETLTYNGTLIVLTCWCGIRHAIPSELSDEQLRERDAGRQREVFCPLGHSHIPAGPSRLDRERESVASLERQLDNSRTYNRSLRDQLEASERSKAALKGHLTRYRKRVANGVCPVAGCRRHFTNVQRHVATQHAEWMAEHPEVFEEST